MSRERRSATQASVLAGEDWQVICHVYQWSGPILAISAGSSTISISVLGREDMPASGVAFARQLVRAAERFAAECERLHELRSQASGNSDAQVLAPQARAITR
jgi:hypothetical protein